MAIIAAATVGLFAPAAASAYQHQANTIQQCRYDTEGRAHQVLGFVQSIYVQAWHRYSDNDAYVQLGYYRTAGGGGMRVRFDCRYVGHDSSNGGVAYSFRWNWEYPVERW